MEATKGWELKARVLSRVSLDTKLMAFADMATHNGDRVSKRFRAKCHVPLSVIDVNLVPKTAGVVRVYPLPDSSDEYEIEVSPSPELPVGHFKFDVNIGLITPEKKSILCSSIPVYGEMQSKTKILPPQLFLGERQVGEICEAEIVLKLGDSSIDVTQIEADTGDIIFHQSGKDLDGSVHYRISQHIANVGDQACCVTIKLKHKDGHIERLITKVTYYGVNCKGEK